MCTFRGLVARSVIQAQTASPTFTHVYAALVSVVNTKVCTELPQDLDTHLSCLMYLHVLDFLLHLEKVFSDCSCYQMTFWFGIIILMHNNLWFEEIFIYPASFLICEFTYSPLSSFNIKNRFFIILCVHLFPLCDLFTVSTNWGVDPATSSYSVPSWIQEKW